jgi:hypothetical protein
MGGMSVVEVVRAADGKCYPAHPLDEAERSLGGAKRLGIRLPTGDRPRINRVVRRPASNLAGRVSAMLGQACPFHWTLVFVPP